MSHLVQSHVQAVTSSFRSQRGFSLEAIIGGWLDAKFSRSESPKTETAYRSTLLHFQAFLQANGVDLIYESETFHVEIADAAQLWSQMREARSHHKGEVAPATRQQRLAVLSSFYSYALKKRHLSGGNPLDMVERPQVEAYAASVALPPEEVQRRLEAIDAETLDGQRDLALLSVLLATGRRVSEVANLRRRDIQLIGDQIKLSFQRTKGRKSISDLLEPEVSSLLLNWLDTNYRGRFLRMEASTPLWVDVHHESRRRKPLGYDGIAGVCLKYLGTSKVHTTRGTFTILMLVANAKLTDIQQRLQHNNVATTGIYANKLTQEYNQYAGKVTELMGLKNRQRDEKSREGSHAAEA